MYIALVSILWHKMITGKIMTRKIRTRSPSQQEPSNITILQKLKIHFNI